LTVATFTDLESSVAAIRRALQKRAIFPAYNSDSVNIMGKIVAVLNQAQGDIVKCRLAKATDLNAEFQLAIATLGIKGSTTTFGAGSCGFVAPQGLIGGSYTTGTLYKLATSGGTLATYSGGENPAVAIGLGAATAFFFGRTGPRADNTTVDYNASGKVEIKQTSTPIASLTAGASLGAVISKINSVLSRLTTYHMNT
jgi:hypothetical protein